MEKNEASGERRTLENADMMVRVFVNCGVLEEIIQKYLLLSAEKLLYNITIERFPSPLPFAFLSLSPTLFANQSLEFSSFV